MPLGLPPLPAFADGEASPEAPASSVPHIEMDVRAGSAPALLRGVRLDTFVLRAPPLVPFGDGAAAWSGRRAAHGPSWAGLDVSSMVCAAEAGLGAGSA